MKRIAIVPASGLGDGLIFHIFSHNLKQAGYEVVTFNKHLAGLGSWLEGYNFSNEDLFDGFDAIILQHDNSDKAKNIKNAYRFYGSHQISKHGELKPMDYVCDRSKTMVQNVQIAMKQWFGLDSFDNGLKIPEHLVHRKYPKRIAIHPDSSSPDKNWPHFGRVARVLENKGFEPVFITNENRPLFAKLEDLASFIYESGAFLGTDSGPGHLASYLKIPTMTIGSCKRHMRHWKPGWLNPLVITPPSFVSHFKLLRPKWKSFISEKCVIKLLLNHINNYNKEER